MIDYVRGRVCSGDDLGGLAADVRKLTAEAVALLEHGLAGYPLSRSYREGVTERGSRVPIGKRVTQAHLDHFCPGGVGLPVTDSGPIGLGPVGDPPLGSGANAPRSASRPCARCGHPITPAQDARRRITGAWVHETCPP